MTRLRHIVLFAYRDLVECGMGWARGEIMDIVNEISIIQKTLAYPPGASTVLSSKVENNTEPCLQGAHRQMGETDQRVVSAKAKVWYYVGRC